MGRAAGGGAGCRGKGLWMGPAAWGGVSARCGGGGTPGGRDRLLGECALREPSKASHWESRMCVAAAAEAGSEEASAGRDRASANADP